MNFLAHIYLSGDDDEMIIGNFITDFIKGRNYSSYPQGIVKGIKLHREIDRFTDSHPVFLKGRERLKPRYHLYSGVVMDIFYDHFLAAGWSNYSDISLERYIRETYVLFIANFNVLPERVKKIMPLFIVRNWLAEYPDIEGIGRVLERMSLRTGLPAETDFALAVLNIHYKEFESEFAEFFGEMQNHIKGIIL